VERWRGVITGGEAVLELLCCTWSVDRRLSLQCSREMHLLATSTLARVTYKGFTTHPCPPSWRGCTLHSSLLRGITSAAARGGWSKRWQRSSRSWWVVVIC